MFIVGRAKCIYQLRRSDIGSGYATPDGAKRSFDETGFYKDVAPDGAWESGRVTQQ